MMPTETQILQVRQNSVQNTIFALLCGGFVVNGIVITFIAPILPIFMAKWGLDDSRAGLFSLVQFSASLVGVLASSALVSNKGFKPAIVLGLTMLGIGFALLNAPTFSLALLASGLYGLGYGFATPGTNLAAPQPSMSPTWRGVWARSPHRLWPCTPYAKLRSPHSFMW
jgi:fucose permease